ncbi:MAG TPA: prepilin-type N-terminal cleavage/methylation domain-containing protein [Thermoanaerobaculia bacterium]|nr:prepilin-type N-terminal cleavage/methylation domain-containing protein [Thermoanaerobaculia bacterium]
MRNPIAATADLRRNQGGFNLIEMIIATAILGTVALSVASLFMMGRRNVYSGKEMTAAVSMATRVSEDLSGMTLDEVYTAFGIAKSDTAISGGTYDVTVDNTAPKRNLEFNTYTGSIIRRTTDTLVTTAGGNDTGRFLTRWKDEMDLNLRFANGTVNLVITPRNRNPLTAASITLNNATVVRIRTLVRWTEDNRPRQLIVDTLKTNRPNPPD